MASAQRDPAMQLRKQTGVESEINSREAFACLLEMHPTTEEPMHLDTSDTLSLVLAWQSAQSPRTFSISESGIHLWLPVVIQKSKGGSIERFCSSRGHGVSREQMRLASALAEVQPNEHRSKRSYRRYCKWP